MCSGLYDILQHYKLEITFAVPFIENLKRISSIWLFRPSSSASRLPDDDHAYFPRLFFGIW